MLEICTGYIPDKYHPLARQEYNAIRTMKNIKYLFSHT